MTIDAALNLGLAEPAPPEAAPRVAPGTPKKADDVARRSDDDGRVAPKAADDLGRVTPMMAQYLEIKSANPDCLLFYRMGDFYELFFADAEVASRALGIVLTKRGKHHGEDIRMCGVPVERADDYLQRLIGLGHRVAVCEQTEDPAEAKKRGAKSVVRRDVVRIVTPGTITEDKLLAPGEANLLVAVARRKASDEGWAYGLAARRHLDRALRAVGDRRRRARGRDRPARAARDRRAGRDPRRSRAEEPLARDARRRDAASPATGSIRPRPSGACGISSASRRSTASAPSRAPRRPRPGRRCTTSSAPSSAQRPALEPPRREAAAGVLAIDAATRANLELTRTLAGERAGSLARHDRPHGDAPSGARLLAERARRPADRPRRDSRAPGRGRVPGRGGGAARAPARRPARRAGHRPGAVAPGARARRSARPRLPARRPRGRGSDRRSARRRRGAPRRARMRGGAALAALDPACRRRSRRRSPTTCRSTAATAASSAPGHEPALDEARELQTGLAPLHRRAPGALCRRDRLPDLAHQAQPHARLFRRGAGRRSARRSCAGRRRTSFVHRQTMADAMRFSTVELGELQARIASAADRALKIELGDLRRLVATRARRRGADRRRRRGARRHRCRGGARRACRSRDWTRPKVDESLAFRIAGGRHPVVEAALKRDGVALHRRTTATSRATPDRGRGRPGRAHHADHRPEHGRQVDLSAPERAHRRARSDGRLRAGPRGAYRRRRPAVLARRRGRRPRPRALDLHGRDGRDGGDPQPGDARARSSSSTRSAAAPRPSTGSRSPGRRSSICTRKTAAALCSRRISTSSRRLAERLPRLSNATLKVTEWEGDVVFLHEVVPGAADRSYGLQVARLAGLPPAVVDRAQDDPRRARALRPRAPEARPRRRPAAVCGGAGRAGDAREG